MVLAYEQNFSEVVTRALEMWLEKKLEKEKWALEEDAGKKFPLSDTTNAEYP